MKGCWLVVSNLDLTWSLPIKTGSLRVFGHRVSSSTAGQEVRRTDKVVTATDKSGSVQDWSVLFYDSWLVGYGIYVYKRASALNASFGSSTSLDDNW